MYCLFLFIYESPQSLTFITLTDSKDDLILMIQMFQLKFWWTEWIPAGLPCRPECWWAWSQRCILKESSSGNGGESQAWRGPVGHSGSFPTQIKKVRCEKSWWRQREMLRADVNLLLPSQTGTAGIFGRTRCTCWKTKRRDRQVKKKKVGLLQDH